MWEQFSTGARSYMRKGRRLHFISGKYILNTTKSSLRKDVPPSYCNRFLKNRVQNQPFPSVINVLRNAVCRQIRAMLFFSFITFTTFRFRFLKSSKDIPTSETIPNTGGLYPKRAVKKKTFKFFLKHGTNLFTFGGVA